MALTVYSWGAYATYNHKEIPFRDEDSQVYVMVKVAKGELTTRQYRNVKAMDGRTYLVSTANPQGAFEVFGQYGAHILSAQKNALIVPVPSSSHIQLGQPFTGARLVDAIVQRLPKAASVSAAPILAFKQVMPRASKGEANARDKALIKGALTTSVKTLSGPVFLVDDVCTSGAHLMACAEFLRDLGADVRMAVCIGRTSSTQHPTPLAVPPEDIEDQFSLFFGH